LTEGQTSGKHVQGPTPSVSPEKAKALAEYRSELIAQSERSQTSFDKTLLSLSGGALGVSFAFVKDFIPPTLPGAIATAWACWILSCGSVLTSHFLSVLATRKGIEEVDRGTAKGQVGGHYATAVDVFNVAGGLAFVAGLIAAGVFVFRNV